MYIPYAGAAGMLLYINGKFTMWKLRSSQVSFWTDPHFSLSVYMLGYEADLALSVVSFISSSIMGYAHQYSNQILNYSSSIKKNMKMWFTCRYFYCLMLVRYKWIHSTYEHPKKCVFAMHVAKCNCRCAWVRWNISYYIHFKLPRTSVVSVIWKFN